MRKWTRAVARWRRRRPLPDETSRAPVLHTPEVKDSSGPTTRPDARLARLTFAELIDRSQRLETMRRELRLGIMRREIARENEAPR